MSTSAAESIFWKFEDLLNCMICFESFRNPKMLTCGHTFCADCLTDYYHSYEKQRRAVPGHIPCPTCRELTKLPPGGVSALRTDFKIQKLEDLFKTMNVKQNQQQQPTAGKSNDAGNCASCQAQNKKTKGVSFCANCTMSFCDSCLGKHNRNVLFQNHKVTRVQSDSNGNLADNLFCKKHSGEQGKYICQSCQLIVCTACIVNEHADHDVAEMTSLLLQQQKDVSNLRNMVQSKNDQLKSRINEIETIRKANKLSSERSEAAIKERSKQAMDAVRQAEAALLNELREATKDRLSALDRELDRIKYNITKTQIAGDYASATSRMTSVHMIALHDELVQRMRTVVDADSADDVDLLQTVVSFRPTKNTIELGQVEFARVEVETPVVPPKQTSGDRQAKLGSPAFVAPAVRTPSAAAAAASDGRRQTFIAASSGTPPPSVRTGAVVSPPPPSSSGSRAVPGKSPKLLIHVSGYGDRPGELKDPLGVACLLNGDIIVSEWGNKRLQVFDANGRSVRVISPGQIGPQGIALTLKGNVISTDLLQKRLQVFDPSGNPLSKWGIGKFFSPCGVAISPNGNCVVSDSGDHSVSIYRGETTCICRFGSQGSRDDQFDNPLYVTTGVHNEIFVSDSNNHCVKVFDSKGQFMRKVGSDGSGNGQLKFPRGVCVDHQGNLLVADRNNDRISLFNASGQFVRHLVNKDDGLKAPYGVGITIAGQLVITESGSNRAALKVYQL